MPGTPWRAVALAGGFPAAGIALWTWLALYPPLPRDLGGAPDLDREARRVRFAVAPGDSLEGWILPGRRGVLVVLLHGYGRTHSRMWRYGHFLHRAGYAVFAYDARSARRSARLPTTLGTRELVDARAALAWTRSAPETRGMALVLYGESLGASVALVAAAGDTAVRAVVAESAFSDAEAALRDGMNYVLPVGGLAPLARAWARMWAGEDAGELDAARAMPALADRPVLLVHGSRDRRVSPENSRRLRRAGAGRPELWMVEGAAHAEAWRLRRAGYEARVLRFLEAALGRS